MPNNIAVAVTVDVAQLANLALAKAAVADTGKAMRAAAADANGAMTPALLQAADAAAKATAAQTQLARQIKAGSAASVEMKAGAVAATSAMSTLSHGSAGVTRELLVMGRELARGNFNRMAGSATILAGRLGVLTPTLLMTAGAIALLAAPVAAFTLASIKGAEQLAKFQNALTLTNGYAGVTISQLQAMSRQLAQSTNVSIGEATTTMTKLAASGKFTGDQLLLVGQNATIMGRLTGEGADKFVDEFARMGEDVTKFALDFQNHYHMLSAAQIEHIAQLQEEGRSTEAMTELSKDLFGYLGNTAPGQLHGLEGAVHSLGEAFSSAWDKAMAFARVVEGIGSNADKIRVIDAELSRLQSGSSVARFGVDEGRIADLEKQRAALVAGEHAQEAQARAASEAAQRQTEGARAAEELRQKFESSKTSGEKLKKALADINDELAKAKAADPGNASKYEAEAAAARAQAVKSDTPHAPKAKDDTVQQWTEQLRAQQIASGDYFRDATADELKFWQSKLALVAKGSKDWLEVQGKVFEASKTLARQAYQDQIADYNEKIAADRDNWAKEQADLQAKLAYIKSTYGQQSAEYKTAYREMEATQREHDEKELREAQEHINKLIAQTKRGLDEAAKAREDDARAAETVVKANAGNTPFGEIAADQQVAQIYRQVTEQKIADNETLHTSETTLLDDQIAKAVAQYGQDKGRYQALLDQKAAADQAYASKKRKLDAQLRQQSIQDTLAMQQAYSGYISGTVNATVTGFDKIISGQKTWSQVGISIYQSVVREAEQQVAKMVTNWITQHLLMTSAQRAQLAVQQSTQAAATSSSIATTVATSKAQVTVLAGLAGAGGVASMAAAPWPLDMTAPAFGAEMASTALSLGSFAQGVNVVPNDMIAQVHAGERIMPKADNAALIALTARAAGAGDGAGGGATHNHFSPTVNASGVDDKAIMGALEDNFSDFTRLLKRAARNGAMR